MSIYEKKFRPMTDIERNMFSEFCRAFDKAVDKAFPDMTLDDPDKAFYDALKNNNAVFAAFKTHRAQNDIAAQLLDEKGDLKPFSRFSNDVQTIVDHHCRRWLNTEYNTAIIRAQRAADWQGFLRDKDLFPNLEWMRSTSITPGLDHVPFWGMIRPIEDVIWTQHCPGDRWNCKCRLRSTDKEPTGIPGAIRPVDRPSPGLDNNPGVDGKLFSDSHPYIANARKGAKEAVERFIKERNRNVYLNQRQKQIKEQLASVHVLRNAQFDRTVELSRRGIKEYLNQPHEFYEEKNELLLNIENVFRDAQYMGYLENFKNTPRLNCSHIFEIQIMSKRSWLVVREYDQGQCVFYGVSDAEKILTGIKKK